MKAMAFDQFGGVETIREFDLPVPDIGPDEVLVRVRACGLNHLDLWIRHGLPIQIPMPHIGGCEVAGVVERVGSAVTGIAAGQPVLIAPNQGCGNCDACRRDDEPACRQFQIVGEHTQGGFAEFAKAHARHIIPVSDAWSLTEWAATPLVFLTAWRMLHRRGRVATGDNVLVQGGASGVGSAAIQIAKLAGARVFTTVGSDAKAKLCRDLGADVIVRRDQANFADVIKAETKGRGVDIVIEHVGEAVWKDSLKCLAHGGRLVTCGATTGPQVGLDLRFFFIREIQVLGSCMGSSEELRQVLELLGEHALRPVLDRTFPLAQLAQAHEYLESRQQLGKVVIEI